ncbi:G_PROTEIN_RECEP_F1_2 domain-containing protein [Meloidogyne graminicola]|uniref:G_PROTEIN_RECEP_F1_2 domain-containing protein n=1 Tax=Meloidogyne graminicola TaxID=189291 RepID=A0A8S9ZHR5_9BILA|nr:G_PROTEIN_RECEP_F1_2 domain-containing protein [Meloidogyne graminicola]
MSFSSTPSLYNNDLTDPNSGPSGYDDNQLIALIRFHSIDIIMLTLLALADLFTSIGVLDLGLMRKALFTTVMETSRVPVETSWTCAGKPFVYLRLLGALIPPGIVFWISIERFVAVFASDFYRKHIIKHQNIPSLFIIFYTIIAVSIAYTIAWLNRNKGPVEAYCGRKVAFTKGYTTYVYLADVLGFVIALLVNCITLCRLGHLYAQRENRFEVKKQVRRIHYLLLISIMSTLTVAIPNGISLVSAWFGRLNIALSDPANWMIAAKCSVNLFIYLVLKADFRQRIYEILGCLSVDDWQDKGRVFGNTSRNVGGRDNEGFVKFKKFLKIKKKNIANNSNVLKMNNLGKSINTTDNLASDNITNPAERQRRESARKAWTTNSQFHFESLEHI